MIIRFVIVLVITLIAFLLQMFILDDIFSNVWSLTLPVSAFVITTLIVGVEYLMSQRSNRQVFFAFLGTLLGIIIGSLVGYSVKELTTLYTQNEAVGYSMMFLIQIMSIYFGFILGYFKLSEMEITSLDYKKSKKAPVVEVDFKILDTSVIIDGRIADIAETGFLEGALVVPKFVLKELQQVADSSDPLKRSRGRRGLDILNKMKSSKRAIIKITDTDFPEIRDVDNKLLKLASMMGGVIVTNDFNLNKVAEIQGVRVLNVNELSNAVKPIVLPNEELRINIIKEGKDQKQGIAYLDDGTMIVVDNGKEMIGKEVDVVVTSVLQTPAGRMIFTQLANEKKSPSHSGSRR